MCKEPTIGISRALGIARAFWELANDAVNDGTLPKAQATSMGKAATEGAATVRGVIADFGHLFSPELTRAAQECVVDLETLAELAGLVVSYNLTNEDAPHLARAMRHTAAQTIRALMRTENALGAQTA
jgi:hypothetical protein